MKQLLFKEFVIFLLVIRCSRHLWCRLIADRSAPLICKIVPEESNDQCRYIAWDESLKAGCDVWSECECSAGSHSYCCHNEIEYYTEYSSNNNVQKDPETNLGIVRITEDGKAADLLWGYKDGGRFTSEFPAHMMSHIARLKANPENRIILHTHPTYTLAMTHVHTNDEAKFTHTLWRTCTECIVVFPDGIGVLPWMICGNNEIGEATAKKMEEYRVVIWGIHGIYGAGKDPDEAFGLVETVEKAAQLYMLTAHLPIVNEITDDQLRELAAAFKLTYREDFMQDNK